MITVVAVGGGRPLTNVSASPWGSLLCWRGLDIRLGITRCCKQRLDAIQLTVPETSPKYYKHCTKLGSHYFATLLLRVAHTKVPPRAYNADWRALPLSTSDEVFSHNSVARLLVALQSAPNWSVGRNSLSISFLRNDRVSKTLPDHRVIYCGTVTCTPRYDWRLCRTVSVSGNTH